MSIREFDFQKQRVRVRTTSCADAHVACDFGHHAILLDVKANFAKRGTPIQSQNSHGSSLIVVLEKSSVRLSSRRVRGGQTLVASPLLSASGLKRVRFRSTAEQPSGSGRPGSAV